jgi:hypothetical protein
MSLVGIVTTVLVAGALAVATTVGVVQVAEQSPTKTPPVDQPLIVYGGR